MRTRSGRSNPLHSNTMSPRRSTNAADRTRVATRRQRALRLRQMGLTYDEIVRSLRDDPDTITPKAYSRPDAWHDVNNEMVKVRDQTSETARDVLDLELSRLDGITRGSYQAAVQGDTAAALTVLRAMDRRAKLLGLDQPSRHEIMLTPDVIAAEIERLEAIVEPDDGSTD